MRCGAQGFGAPLSSALQLRCGELAQTDQHRPRCVARQSVYSGKRSLVSVVIDNVAVGVPRDEILRSYPVLTEADIEAALAYAAELAREGTADLPLETKA